MSAKLTTKETELLRMLCLREQTIAARSRR